MSIGNANIHQVSEIPEITKLPNGRLRVVRRFNKFTREDVDNANYGSLMGDFGDLDTEGQQIVNQGYTDLQLISVEVDTRFNSASNNSNPVLVKTYETLTSSFVQVTDEDQIEELENGTKRLTKVFRAQSGTTYTGDVGTTNAGGSNTSFILAKSDLKDSGAFAELTLTFFKQDTVLSVTEDKIGSQNAIVNEIFNPSSESITGKDTDGNSLSGYSEADRTESNHDGIKTIRVRFLQNDVVLSRSKDSVGSQKSVVLEVFNGDNEVGDANSYGDGSNYVLAREEESNVDGVKTRRYTYLEPSILSVEESKNTPENRITVRVFNLASNDSSVSATSGAVVSTTSHILVSQSDQDYEGIKTSVYVFESKDYNTKTTNEFGRTVIDRVEQSASNFALQSQSSTYTVDSVADLKILNQTIENNDNDVNKRTTRFTTVGIDDVREDIVGSQKAIIITKVGAEPTATEVASKSDIGYDSADDWSIARKDNAREGGLDVYTYTFLLNNTILSETEDRKGSLKTNVIEVFNPKVTIPGIRVDGGSNIAGDYYQNSTLSFGKKSYKQYTGSYYEKQIYYNGYTSQWQMSLYDTTYSTSTDTNPDDSNLPPTTGWSGQSASELYNFDFTEFDTTLPGSAQGLATSHRYEKDGYSLINLQKSAVDGIPTMRYTFAKDNSVLSVSEDKLGAQKAIVNEIFNPTSETITGVDSDNNALSGYSEVDRTESDYEGIKTIRVRFLKNDSILSVSEDFIGSQKAIVNEVFNPHQETVSGKDTSNQALSGYSEADRTESNYNGIKTIRVRFLKDNVTLSQIEDYIGSQKRVVKEVFNPTNGQISAPLGGYIEASKETSNVSGVPTIRITFLKQNTVLSVSEDKVGSQLAVVNEVFDPTGTITGQDADGTTLSGYSEADRTISEFEGIETVRVRFLKNSVTLSTSEDKVGSQLAIVKEVFNGTPSTPSGYSIADEQISSVDGIPTRRFRFLKTGAILSTSEDKVGSQKAVVIEKFGSSAPTTGSTINGISLSGYSLAREEESNVAGIKTYRYTFLKPSILSVQESKNTPENRITVRVFNLANNDTSFYASTGTEVDSDTHILVSENNEDFEGIKTSVYVFESRDYNTKTQNEFGRTVIERVEQQISISFSLQTDASYTVDGVSDLKILNQRVENNDNLVNKRITTFTTVGIDEIKEEFIGSQKAIVITKVGAEPTVNEASLQSDAGSDSGSDFSIARKDNSRAGGLDVYTYTFMRKNSLLSETEDKVGSQLAIVKEVFDGTPGTPTNYVIAKEEESNVSGIPTKRYTFLKPSILSVAQDFVEDINTIQVIAFNKTESEVKSDLGEVTNNHKLISKRENDHDGIVTTTFTFEINTSDVVRYTSNNRLQVVRTIYEAYNYDYDANYDVGNTSITFESTTLVLSELRVNKRGDTGTFVKLDAVFTEPGESARSESVGPNSLPGTEQITITSSGSTPVTLTETSDIKLINKQQQNNNGFSVFIRSYIKGTDATATTDDYVSGRTYKIASNGDYSAVGGPSTGVIGDYFEADATDDTLSVTAYLVGQIAGTKVTYDNIISVNVPGTVQCKTREADLTDINALADPSITTNSLERVHSKTQSYLEVIPASTKKIKVDVIESIQTSIPSINQLAYNLDDINCSVAKVNTTYSQAGSGYVTNQIGTHFRYDYGWNRNINFQTGHSYFPGCYILDTDNTAEFNVSKGNLYRITSNNSNYNFVALGAPNNNVGTVFTATSSASGISGQVKDLGTTGRFRYGSSKNVYATNAGTSADYGKSDQKAELIPVGTTAQSDGSAPASYVTTGIIQQNARPVLTTIDGTTYYEVIQFSKS